MGGEFQVGRGPIALTVNNMSSKANMERLEQEVKAEFETTVRMDAWTRTDFNSKTYKTANRSRLPSGWAALVAEGPDRQRQVPAVCVV